MNIKVYLLQETRLREAAVLSNAQKPTHRIKENEETEEYVPNKRTDKSLETDFNEMEIHDLPDIIQNKGH